jgi:hypothetical protein
MHRLLQRSLSKLHVLVTCRAVSNGRHALHREWLPKDVAIGWILRAFRQAG